MFAPISLIVKGAEGFIAGKLSGGGLAYAMSKPPDHPRGSIHTGLRGARQNARRLMPALVAGACVMVGGYFLAETTVLALFDRAFGIAAAVAELPFNILQGGASVILARLAIEGFKRTKII